MKDIKVVISSPIDTNLYALLVNHLCLKEKGVSVSGIITLKTLSFKRINSEYKRIGSLLVVKILKKLFANNSDKNFLSKNMDNMISSLGLKQKSLKAFSDDHATPFIKVNDLNNFETITFLKMCKPDLVLSIGSTIIRKSFLEIPSIGVLNVHMGILPEYRGMGVTEWPLIEERANDIGLGVTLHFMDSGVDTGPIIKKQKINISDCQSLHDLESKYLIEMVSLMLDGVRMVRDKKLTLEPQKNNEIDMGRQYYSTHNRMRKLAEKRLIMFK